MHMTLLILRKPLTHNVSQTVIVDLASIHSRLMLGMQ